MNIFEMTKKDFEALPSRRWDDITPLYDSIVLLPTKVKHDSGYKCMYFIGVVISEAICKIGGGCDSVEFEVPNPTMDILPKSNLFHMWSFGKGYRLQVSESLSSMTIRGVKK